MIKLVCSRCEKELPFTRRMADRINVYTDNDSLFPEVFYVDLCNECRTDFLAWLKEKPSP